MRALVFAIVLLLLATVADACPVCGTSTGDEVRAGIFGADFLRNVGVSVLPFAVVAGMVRVVSPLLSRIVHSAEEDR